MEALETKLAAGMDELLAYARRKIGDEALAADAVQNSLLKALRAAPALRDQNKIFPWFYRILDNTITDIFRGLQRERKHMAQFALETETSVPPEEKSMICQCFIHLLPTLKPDYAEIIQALDLDEKEPADVAAQLGITRGNLKVRHHRARRQLRARLEETCRICSEHGCFDCSCQSEGSRMPSGAE